MKYSVSQGFFAGCVGAVILVFIMYILEAVGLGSPGFVNMYKALFGSTPPGGEIIAALLFIVSGGIWGIIYTWLVRKSTALKGFIFGLLPTLWLLIVVNSVIGKPLFTGLKPMGIIMPLIFNMVIWGSFVGWYLARMGRKPEVAT